MPDHSDTGRLLRAHDPIGGGVAMTDGLARALDELGADITCVPRPARERRRTRRWRLTPRSLLLSGAIVAVIAGGAAAATQLLSTHTGHYATGWEINAGGPGEYLRISGTGFCQAGLRLSSDLAYPPGYGGWRPWVLVAEEGVKHITSSASCGSDSAQAPPSGAHEVSTGALHGFFAMSSFCAWVYDWRHAKLSGNHDAAERAAEMIDGAPHWNAVLAEDPHPTAGPVHQERYGLTGQHSLFGWFLPFRSAVLRGDITQVDKLIASNYGTAGCSYFDPPASSHGGTTLPTPSKS
jgi:hypothetical protein